MAGLSLMPLGVRADEKGDELLKASFSKLHSAKTFSAKVEKVKGHDSRNEAQFLPV
jgi:hypothetical protein